MPGVWAGGRLKSRSIRAGRMSLLALLIYGYAVGMRSSRRIERACTEDVAFWVVCAQDVPDHATIARFRRAHFADAAAMGQLLPRCPARRAGAAPRRRAAPVRPRRRDRGLLPGPAGPGHTEQGAAAGRRRGAGRRRARKK